MTAISAVGHANTTSAADRSGVHDQERTAVGLSRDHRHPRDRRFGERVEQFGAVADDAVVLLSDAGEEPGNVDHGDERDVERVAEADESCGLLRSGDVERSGERSRLVPDDADRVSIEPGESDDDVRGEVLVHLIELTVVDDRRDDIDHVVRLVRRVRDDRREDLVHPLGTVERREERSDLHVVLRKEREQEADLLHRGAIVRHDEVRHAGSGRVGVRTAEFFHRDVFAGHGLDDLRSGDEQVRGLFDLVDEVGDGRRVHGTTGARSHDDRDLGDDTGRTYVALEDAAVAVKRGDTLLDPGAARVLDADQRRAVVHREIHHLADLVGDGGSEAPAVGREVLGEQEHRPPVDGSVSGDDRVAGRAVVLDAEPGGVMPHEHVELLERVLVEEEFDTLAGGQLAEVVLAVDRALVCRGMRRLAQDAQLLDAVFGAHRPPGRLRFDHRGG